MVNSVVVIEEAVCNCDEGADTERNGNNVLRGIFLEL